MAITSNLKGLRVVNGTTLIRDKNDLSGVKKGGDGRHKFIQTLISTKEHRALVILALDMDITLTVLVRQIIHNF